MTREEVEPLVVGDKFYMEGDSKKFIEAEVIEVEPDSIKFKDVWVQPSTANEDNFIGAIHLLEKRGICSDAKLNYSHRKKLIIEKNLKK